MFIRRIENGDRIKILPYLDNNELVWGKPHIIISRSYKNIIFNVGDKLLTELCVFNHRVNGSKVSMFKKYYFNSLIDGNQQTIRLGESVKRMLTSDIFELNTKKHLVIVDKKVELGYGIFSNFDDSYIEEFDFTIPDSLDSSPIIDDYSVDNLKSIFGEETYNSFISEMRDKKINEILKTVTI
jgi:hypothetical protein